MLALQFSQPLAVPLWQVGNRPRAMLDAPTDFALELFEENCKLLRRDIVIIINRRIPVGRYVQSYVWRVLTGFRRRIRITVRLQDAVIFILRVYT